MDQSTLTTKGQTTLPKAVRDALDLKPGDTVKYRIEANGDVRILKTRSVMDMAGTLHRPGRPAATLDDMDAAIARGVADRSHGKPR